MQVFILCRNESKNIGRCIEAFRELEVSLVVLDNQSTDDSRDIARRLGAEIRDFEYVNHCKTYNSITKSVGSSECCLILDADMIVTPELSYEISKLCYYHEVIESPIRMVYEGVPLSNASLCPPKAICFRGGAEYFLEQGHGEVLRQGVTRTRTKNELIHDDRKDYLRFLESQVRYAESLASRWETGMVSFKDRLRCNTPLLILAVPFLSFFVRFGFRDGRTGAIYAMDRLIAEAIMYRRALLADRKRAKGE